MMYNSKLVAAIKVNGKVLREFKDQVQLPFGSEYSIYLKNLNVLRVIVNASIDGTEVVPGGLVLNPGQEIDLERSIVGGNLNAGNKFKFIERTSGIEEFRGIKTEDGILRIEFQFERDQPRCAVAPFWNTGSLGGSLGDYSSLSSASPLRKSLSRSDVRGASSSFDGITVCTNSMSDAGITVPGSTSTQKFKTVDTFPLEIEKHVMVFMLVGAVENQQIETPVEVATVIQCVTCGKQNSSAEKFCSNCGTAVKIIK